MELLNHDSLLHGKYKIVRLIGQGGFGQTYLAEDIRVPNNPRCVVKQFFPLQLGNSSSAKVLFSQEAQRLKQLGTHPQIPALIDYVESDDGNQYLIQEWIDGENLEQELVTEGAFSEAKIHQLLAEILPILDFVHSHQVIHRDVKPANIIRRRNDGQLELVDFGAAKYATANFLAKTGTTIGSAGYAAPEQTFGRASYASDLFSLGVTCIHLLTGIEPFDLFSTSQNEWVWRDFLPSPISYQLGKILDRLLERGTSNRYQQATEVLADLARKPPLPRLVSHHSRSTQIHVEAVQPSSLSEKFFNNLEDWFFNKFNRVGNFLETSQVTEGILVFFGAVALFGVTHLFTIETNKSYGSASQRRCDRAVASVVDEAVTVEELRQDLAEVLSTEAFCRRGIAKDKTVDRQWSRRLEQQLKDLNEVPESASAQEKYYALKLAKENLLSPAGDRTQSPDSHDYFYPEYPRQF